MNNTVRLIAAAAAVVVVALIGYQLLVAPSVVGPGPSPSPSDAASVESPTPTATEPWQPAGHRCGPGGARCAGPLAPGTYTSQSLDPAVTFTVESGWINVEDWPEFFLLIPDTPSDRAISVAEDLTMSESSRFLLVVPGPLVLASDGCAESSGATAASATDFANAMAAKAGLDVVGPTDVTVSGMVGSQVDIGLEQGWTETCPSDPTTPVVQAVPNRFVGADHRLRVIALDRPDGGPIQVQIWSTAADFESFLELAMPVVESFEFEP